MSSFVGGNTLTKRNIASSSLVTCNSLIVYVFDFLEKEFLFPGNFSKDSISVLFFTVSLEIYTF